MALLATNRFAGDGATTSYEFNFVGKYIARTHVKVYQEDNATKVRTPVAITDSNFLNDTTLRNLPVTPAGKTLVIYRDTPKPPLVDFTNGSRFTEYNMDLVARQGLFVAMEAMDAGDIDAREQLLAAIAAAAGLVKDATVAVSDATAAALAAATNASNAAASASAVDSAKTAAQTAQTGAEAAAAAAAASATAANTSKNAAATSASNAAGSATTAATQAGNANTSANNANAYAAAATSGASAAAVSASNANASAVQSAGHASTAQAAQVAAEAAAAAAVSVAAPAKVMACKFERVHTHLCKLVGYVGNTVLIGGIARAIPSAGVSLPLAGWGSEIIYYVYASWSGSEITLSASTAAPEMNQTYGYETQTGVAGATLVGAFARLESGFVDTPRARWTVSRYNQPPRLVLSSAHSNASVASGMTSPILSAWAVTLGAAVDVSGGGQTSCGGYARAFVRINEVNTPGAATMQGTATVSLGHLVARTYAEVGPGFFSLQAVLHAINAYGVAIGGEEAGWHLMAMLHPT